jgi:hypothetical protein
MRNEADRDGNRRGSRPLAALVAFPAVSTRAARPAWVIWSRAARALIARLRSTGVARLRAAGVTRLRAAGVTGARAASLAITTAAIGPLAAAFEGPLILALIMGILIGAHGLVDPGRQEFEIEQFLSCGRGRHPFSLTPSEREVNSGEGWRGAFQPEID